MGDATMSRRPDTQLVSLPVNPSTRERRASGKTCCDLAHCCSPLGLGTDGSEQSYDPFGGKASPFRCATRTFVCTAMANVMVRYQARSTGDFARPLRVFAPVRCRQPICRPRLSQSSRRWPNEAESGWTGNFNVSISVLPTVFAAAVFGPLAAMIVACVFVHRRVSIRRPAIDDSEPHPATRFSSGASTRASAAIYGASGWIRRRWRPRPSHGRRRHPPCRGDRDRGTRRRSRSISSLLPSRPASVGDRVRC